MSQRSAATCPSNPLLDGLISYWPFDSNANDAEGNSPSHTETSAGGQIGARISPTEYFSGYIDEVGVWNRALSSSEVSQLYNSGSGQNPLARPIMDQALAQEQEIARVPIATRLAGNYPNPFNPETIIHYEMASAEQVHLEIYDLLGQSDKVYLGVRAVAKDERFSGERLSLAETGLSMEARRQLRWDTHEVFRNWPGGSVLFLEANETGFQGNAAEVPVRWSFRRPGPPPFDKPEILASGMINLSMRKMGEEWKVSHVERLIGALHAEVVKEQK